MSVETEITRIENNVKNALNAVADLGIEVPSGATSDDLPGLISEIGATVVKVTQQTFTDGQKTQARTNIGAASLADLNKKANDFSIELYNGTNGNPKPVRFASFNYSTCTSEEGIAAKISMVSGHGNGSSYAFLQDAIIKVGYNGSVTVDNFKYYGQAVTDNGVARQYGDIFWLVDTENKIVDFYCLMGQYSRLNMTPWKRLTYSSKGAVTQYTNCTVYSSGEKVWANNSNIAMLNDLNDLDMGTF